MLRIFGPKRDEVTGGWRKLHNEELHNLYSSPSIIRMIESGGVRWGGHVAPLHNGAHPAPLTVGIAGYFAGGTAVEANS
jgi:hypothetical protein